MDEDGRTVEWLTDAFGDAWRQAATAAGAEDGASVAWGEPAARLSVTVDPDAPYYRPTAGDVEEVAPGVYVIGFAED